MCDFRVKKNDTHEVAISKLTDTLVKNDEMFSVECFILTCTPHTHPLGGYDIFFYLGNWQQMQFVEFTRKHTSLKECYT